MESLISLNDHNFIIYYLLSDASGLIKNSHKYEVISAKVNRGEIDEICGLFWISARTMDSGFHYLGFQIKTKLYKITRWSWIIKKVDLKLKHWTFKWLSIRGRLILIKVVL